jgi:hypothetical protein
VVSVVSSVTEEKVNVLDISGFLSRVGMVGTDAGAIVGVPRHEMRHGHEERSGVDRNRDMDRTRAGDEDHGIVEIVVIPVPGDPRGIGRVGVGGWDDPDEEGDDP